MKRAQNGGKFLTVFQHSRVAIFQPFFILLISQQRGKMALHLKNVSPYQATCLIAMHEVRNILKHLNCCQFPHLLQRNSNYNVFPFIWRMWPNVQYFGFFNNLVMSDVLVDMFEFPIYTDFNQSKYQRTALRSDHFDKRIISQ